MTLEQRAAAEDTAAIQDLQKRYGAGPFLAADAVVESKDGYILTARRGNAPGRGLRCLPGGKLDEGETFYMAAKRELGEETGLKLVVRGKIQDIDLDPFYDGHMLCDEPGRDPRGRWISLAVHFKLPYRTGQLHVEPLDDALDVEWVRKRDFKNFADDQFFADHLRVVRYFVE